MCPHTYNMVRLLSVGDKMDSFRKEFCANLALRPPLEKHVQPSKLSQQGRLNL